MSKKWEERKVRTSEDIFSEIKTEMDLPVSVIILGADCDFKNEVMESAMNELQGFARYYTKAPDTAKLFSSLKIHRVLVITLSADESCMLSLRRELVETLRKAGAKSVIGIYAKARKMSRMCFDYGAKAAETNRQIAAIERSNPAAEEFDRLVIAKEKKEG